MSLPMTGYHSYEHFVRDMDRAVKFYTETLGYKVIGKAHANQIETDGMERVVLAGGENIHLILSKPLQDWSIAAQYLKRHPEGISFLNFYVPSLQEAFNYLEERGATFLYEPQWVEDGSGKFGQFAIATALDDVSFRFIDASNYKDFAPGFELTQPVGSYSSPFGFKSIDHVTCNVKTLQPLMSFYKEVMGFESFWDIAFHTNDVNPNLPVGSGLKSEVVWHKDSNVKFANNEPLAPFFRNSQIDIYLADNQGSGIQHLAFEVEDILNTMDQLTNLKSSFLQAPPNYYSNIPERLKESGFKGEIDEPLKELEKRALLVDASEKGYLLQIFSLELSRIHNDPQAGALFYELIQRKGDEGFGGGNFRALFETIEIDQIEMKKTAEKLPLEMI
ncbi:MAG: 4-hydroxyphenylpyruvate dioxygenase family protein [Oligoflexales bacterium]